MTKAGWPFVSRWLSMQWSFLPLMSEMRYFKHLLLSGNRKVTSVHGGGKQHFVIERHIYFESSAGYDKITRWGAA